MIILITGTPGTGKTTISRILAQRLGYQLLDVDKIEGAVVGYDEEKESRIVDVDKLAEHLRDIKGDVILEGHFSHLLPFGDLVIVLRASPEVLEKRLDFKGEKLRENLEAEALDVCLIESIEGYSDKVFEVDTSRKNPEEVVGDIIKILGGSGAEFKPGKIDWSEEFFS